MKVISETRCDIKVEASSLLTMSLMKVISETRCDIKVEESFDNEPDEGYIRNSL